MLNRNNKVNHQASLFVCFTLFVLISFVSGRYNLCCSLIGLLPWFYQVHLFQLQSACLPRDSSSEFSIVKTTCSGFLTEFQPIHDFTYESEEFVNLYFLVHLTDFLAVYYTRYRSGFMEYISE